MSSIRMPKEGRRRVSERKEIFPNANKLSAKRELAMKWLHNMYGSCCGKMQFHRKMVCQNHVTVDLEHSLRGLDERRLLNEATEFVHRTKRPAPKGRCCTRRRVSQKGRTNIMYANTINGVLEYNSMYLFCNNKNH